MRWVITRDLIDTNAVGRGNFKGNAADLPHAFRLLDDDGEVYYHGHSDEEDFAPLDWAEAFAGCTSIEYREQGKWTTL